MNQHPPVPAIGLTLIQPKERVEQAIDKMIEKGRGLLSRKADSREMMDNLKRQNWSWVLETSDALKGLFSSESVPQYFSSNVYFVPSLKPDDFERDLDEFPYIVGGRLDRLNGFRKMAAVVPEPPCGDFIAAQFHPAIYHACWRPYELAQYGQAVALAVKEVEDAIALKVAGKYNAFGAELVRQCFDAEEGLLNTKEYTETDNQGMADIMAGFFERYKNLPPSSPMNIQQTSRILSLASYILHTLESIIILKPEGSEPDKPEEQPYEFEFLKD